MEETHEYYQRVNEYLKRKFSLDKSRMGCFAHMVMALIKVRTVNLVESACAFCSTAKRESRYKRIKRFFRQAPIALSSIALWVINLFGLLNTPVYLSLDRTNWYWGKNDINILMLSVVYKGIGLPVFWRLLPKFGNSNTRERIELINRFIGRLGKSRIAGLLADREFVGNDWIGWLLKEKIPFCLRLKNNTITTNSRGVEVDIDALFYDLPPGEQRLLQSKRKLWKQEVYLSGLQMADRNFIWLLKIQRIWI